MSDLPPGFHWIVTRPTAAQHFRFPSASVQGAVEAFRRLDVQRIVDPTDQGFNSIMLELTFANPIPPHIPGILATSLQSTIGRSWLRLRDVRAAHLQRPQLSAAEAADLDAILLSLPPVWARHVRLPIPPMPLWRAIHQPGDDALFEGPDPMDQNEPPTVLLWQLWPSGRLHRFTGTPPPNPVARPALVSSRLKPKWSWLREDWDYHEIQKRTPPKDRIDLVEPWLDGIWDELELDPTTWGIRLNKTDTTSLLALTVKDARQLCVHQNILKRDTNASCRVRGYRIDRAAWPKLWSVDAPEPVAAARDGRLDVLGIDGLEEQWRRTAADRAGGTVALNVPPPWLGLQVTTRPSPADRNAARGQPSTLRPGFVKPWLRLADKTIHRPFLITCWRLLHGSLGCNAFLSHVRQSPPAHITEDTPVFRPEAAYCSSPTCYAAHHPENLTHTFLDCPDSAPVIDWMLATWQHLSGLAAPRTARVLLADDPDGWPGWPTDIHVSQLWTRFRVATIGAIWHTRKAHQAAAVHHGSFARQAATLALTSLTDSIQRDWTRTQVEVQALDDGAFCSDHWRGFKGKLPMGDFINEWAKHPGIFCKVVGDPPDDSQQDDARSLEMLISPSGPVPLPP